VKFNLPFDRRPSQQRQFYNARWKWLSTAQVPNNNVKEEYSVRMWHLGRVNVTGGRAGSTIRHMRRNMKGVMEMEKLKMKIRRHSF
jgi:hypothetical protein